MTDFKDWRDSVFNAVYGKNSALRTIIREDLKQMHKYEELRNPEPRVYVKPKKRK